MSTLQPNHPLPADVPPGSLDPDRLELIVLLDSSGSMASMVSAATTGFDAFMSGQRIRGGACHVSLFDFNDGLNCQFVGRPIHTVPNSTLYPMGGTAMLDAMGTVLIQTLKRLNDNPCRNVLFLIISDGQENTSRTFAKSTIRNMISIAQSTWGWKFAFIGAGEYAWRFAVELGIPQSHTATYTGNDAGMRELFERIAEAVNYLHGSGEFRMLPEAN